jgi:acetyl esterase/lipase
MRTKPETYTYIDQSEDPQQALDLYLPRNLPPKTKLLIFIHGGAWISDDKKDYQGLAEFFTEKGFAVALLNYRLSGKNSTVRHPDHARDVASAVSWLAQNAKRNGLHPEAFYLMGFSAGANLAGLMAFDPAYPAPLKSIRAYIGLEGIYDLPALAKTFPTYEAWFLNLAFGDPPEIRKSASPQHLTASNPTPWLLVHSPDDELVDVAQSENFAAHLSAARVPVTLFTDLHSSHYGVIRAIGTEGDPATAAILKFIDEN